MQHVRLTLHFLPCHKCNLVERKNWHAPCHFSFTPDPAPLQLHMIGLAAAEQLGLDMGVYTSFNELFANLSEEGSQEE